MAADDELSQKLAKRNLINEGEAQPQLNKKIPISAEFKEFSIKEIQFYTSTFKKWDASGDGYDGALGKARNSNNLSRLNVPT